MDRSSAVVFQRPNISSCLVSLGYAVSCELLYWAADEPPMWGFALVFQSELIFCVAYIFVPLSPALSPVAKLWGKLSVTS